MGWFYEQIEQRKKNDDAVFTRTFAQLAHAVTGTGRAASDSGEYSRDAIGEILRFYHLKADPLPDSIREPEQQMEYLMRPHGIMRRSVHLEKGWYRDAFGPMLGAWAADGSPVALLPAGFSGYRFLHPETGRQTRVTKKNQNLFQLEATAFYRPFPLEKITIRRLLRYIAGTLSPADFAAMGLASLAVTLLGLLTPRLHHLLIGPVIEDGSPQLLMTLAVFMACVSVSSLLLGTVKSMLMGRIQTKMNMTVQSATMARILSLPPSFFKEYSSGDLSSRARYIETLCKLLVSAILSTGLTSVFSLAYITQIFVYAPALLVPALAMIGATMVLTIVTTFTRMKLQKRQMELGVKKNGLTYAMISGVQKIKLAGAEKRCFARWGGVLAKEAELLYNPPAFLKYNGVLAMIISLAGELAIYWGAIRSGLSAADYYAFNTAYGMVSGAFLMLANLPVTAAQIRPILEMAKPIMDAVPEVSRGKQVITRLSGGIELSNVSFRYQEHMPWIMDNLSLKIRPGQYIAIVGPTGCGKSTLMRLLLGFETPQKGAVYYDGRDIGTMDLRSLRQKIGVVMQNGKLFSGDIYSNITISAPWLTLEEAWETADLVGIGDDIRQMPMGMHTIISEGGGGISGGQKQRLMIARAIAPRPRILMFDEATSALDNLTQKKVSQSLDSLKCTRIVIAHRLSTVRHCDRILYLENGKIAEEGTYEELMAKKGRFAGLVERQRLDPRQDAGGPGSDTEHRS